ncbi:Oidioi.mRNA.OKI2018_I69.chr2.g4798.t1.cds [Oikopleura dioica]|uniref:Oidioi.mRNA.OKI2018_I69.chr2.g4798.t1.cds n=1 Tax=Oikopleura dioica TaxID=34765 RepID=A0ABN7T017_OIKDI|nr:Oidioi.mRNA.OKI2018_I69.chr2.g4798.t1.cds [Oikopleura dioica]
MTRNASALAHYAHERNLDRIPDEVRLKRSDLYGDNQNIVGQGDDFSSAFSDGSVRSGMPDGNAMHSVYGNRQPFIDPVLEQPRGWNQGGQNNMDAFNQFGAPSFEQGLAIMPERNLQSNFHQEQIMQGQMMQEQIYHQNSEMMNFSNHPSQNASQQMLMQQMVGTQEQRLNMHLPGQAAVFVQQQVTRSSSKEITTEELKDKKPLTKGISFHETVKVKEIPSVSKSVSESSEETSEESSESIEVTPPKKAQPKTELKRTPTQILMDMRNNRGKRWKSGLFGCLIDSSTLLTGVVPCILGIKIATILGEPFGSILCCGGVASMRTKFRMLFDIQGTSCSDCLVSYIFCPCVICQLVNEIEALRRENR